MCCVAAENGEETPLTVIEYITADLEQDELRFHNPLHRKILAEAAAHLHDPGFSAERYFLAHPDPDISRLAAEMLHDRYRLSKYHAKGQKIVSDEERLHELVPHQLTDFKLAILEEEMRQTLQALSRPEAAGDPGRCREILARYKELGETLQAMAKNAGDRVVLKP